jgi:hypothetical protein
MPRTFQRPRCGEPEEITGTRAASGIVLTCDSCSYSWPRDEVPRCTTCAGTDVRVTYRTILALGRASVTSEVGRQETFVCGTCDAEAIARWTDHGHSLPPEYITAAVAVADDAAMEALLAAEIERPRSGPMRDIIATIQPEQDDLVRAPGSPSICVQGAPGTGKTAVGLRRPAYLQFIERERLTGSVLVVGPNDSFLRYTSRVLPALGEIDVRQTTVSELVGRQWTVGRDDAPDAARLKGDPRMTDVLRRAVWAAVGHTWAEVTYAPGSVRVISPCSQVDRDVREVAPQVAHRRERTVGQPFQGREELR